MVTAAPATLVSKPWKIEGANGRRQYGIHIGGVVASRAPAIVRTVLGSCIAVCLRDPLARVGGANHFMLPVGMDGDNSARFGVHAMELLINDCMKMGAERARLEAKVFGGAHVLRMRESDGNVPQSNIRFAEEFLGTENIPVIARDLGGYAAREIYFFTDTGRLLLRRLAETGTPGEAADAADLSALHRAERAHLAAQPQTRRVRPAPAPADDSNVTLF